MISVLSSLYRAIARIRALFQSGNLDRNLDAEIESHIRLRTENYVSRGVLPAEAERLARIEFGGIAQLREIHRETRSLPFIDTLVQDLRYAFRGMRRNAGFTTFTILITGIGIGASSTVFSVVNTLLVRPLPFREPGRLLWMSNGNLSTGTQTEHYSDLRALNRSFSDLAAFADWGVGNRQLTGTGEPDRLTSVPVTANFFTLLGVNPAIGRWFTAEECRQKFSAPPRHAAELQLLATAICLGSWHRGPEVDVGQPASHRGGCAAEIVQLRQYLHPRHANGHLRALASTGPGKAARKHDADHGPIEARSDDPICTSGAKLFWQSNSRSSIRSETVSRHNWSRWRNTSAEQCGRLCVCWLV